MIDLDHATKRGKPFCPVMGECCEAGTTKRMKGTKCAAWQALPMFDRATGLTKEVHACSVYEWPSQLGFEVSGAVQQSRASVDKVATEVNKHHRSFLGALTPEAGQRLLDADPRPRIESQNGQTGAH